VVDNFWKRCMNIGRLHLKNNIFLAPMAGITDLPFRTIIRSFGCGLAFTEMVSANGLVRRAEKTFRYLASSPADRPLGVQLFGGDPETLAAAAGVASERGADLLDVNMGCPVKKVAKTGSGASLMRDPERVAAILRAVRRASTLPLTVKIRAGWNARQVNAIEIGQIAEECGVDAVILHPRTADQGFGGRSDWGLIAALKGRLRIPVIGSGDVRCPEDADRMLRETGCDGVMIGRGAFGNPWLIGNILSYLSGSGISVPSLSEREEIIRRHLTLAIDYYGEKVGTRDFRKHLLWYTKGLRDGARFRQAAGSISDREAAWKALRTYFKHLEESAVAFSGSDGCVSSPEKEGEASWGSDRTMQEYPVDHPIPFTAK
jgi:tRNA-dihydrouridine synthase B